MSKIEFDKRSPAGALEIEINVTPDMIRVGSRRLVYFDIETDDHYRITREILAAIAEASVPIPARHRRKSMAAEPELVCRLRVATLEELFPNR
jgi:hypothetical protein